MAGFLLLAAMHHTVESWSPSLAGITVFLTLAGMVGRIQHYRRVGQARPVSISSATGFTRARIKLFELGHSGPNFLPREFVYTCSARRLAWLRMFALATSCCIPAILLVAGRFVMLGLLSGTAWIAMFVGLLVERWLFFVEARHVVRLYHGEQNV